MTRVSNVMPSRVFMDATGATLPTPARLTSGKFISPKLLLHKPWLPPSLPRMAGASSDKLANRILRGLLIGVVLGITTLLAGPHLPFPAGLQALLKHVGIPNSANLLEAMRGTATVLLDPFGRIFLRLLFFVIIPLLKGHFMMLQRNLIYTAITRGRKKVFIVGEPAAYGMAVRNSEATLRCTHLCEKILAIGG